MSAGGLHLKDEGTRRQAVVAGGIAGLVSRFCIAPLDVVKIRLQLQTHALGQPNVGQNGLTSIVSSIFRKEGITGFWRGNIPAELLYLTYGSCQFTIYRAASNVLSTAESPPALTAFVAGASAAAVATTVTYPFDLLRTRFAAQGVNKVYASLRSSVVKIGREEGIRGFYQGIGVGIGQIVPYMGLLFATYETLRPLMADLDLKFGSENAIAGGISSITSKTIVFPLDLIRKRLQVQGPTRTHFAGGVVPAYQDGLVQTVRAILAKEGWRGMYRGLSISLFKAAPASAVTMWTYERALKEFQIWGVLQ